MQRPKQSRLHLTFALDKYSENPLRVKVHFKADVPWKQAKHQQEKLVQLFKPFKCGEEVQLTGILCHLTVTRMGGLPDNAGWPQTPCSHFFFSVDDAEVVHAPELVSPHI